LCTPAVTLDLGFSGLIRRTIPLSRLVRRTRECGELMYSNPDPHSILSTSVFLNESTKMSTFALIICVYTCPVLNSIIPDRACSSLAHPSLEDECWFCNIGCDLMLQVSILVLNHNRPIETGCALKLHA
jgi:hypothetical protein